METILISAPRELSNSACTYVESIARSHIEQGLHTAAQLAVYRDGELQIDLRLGPATVSDARIVWFSATKPLAAVAALMLVERGAFDLDQPIAAAWPQFADGGKAACTLRHVLTHRGGFPIFPNDFDWGQIDDWHAVTTKTAEIKAVWAPGTATGYHPVTYGFALGELVRRLDGREPREFFEDEIFGPLGMDASLGIPADALNAVVPLEAKSEVTLLDPNGNEHRTSDIVKRFNAAPTLRGQLPAANAIGTAEALARFYDCLLQGGSRKNTRMLQPETVIEATKIQWTADYDRTTTLPASYGLGFLIGGPLEPFDEPGVYGHTGQQCCIGYADPIRGLAVAYLTNGLQGPVELQQRYREVALALIKVCTASDQI
jgi:CubicO group peptidase (beta-lactamase class C family)